MTIKAVETIRHIRDAQATQTQDLSSEETIAFYRKKAEEAMRKIKDLCGTRGIQNAKNAVVAEDKESYGTEQKK